MQFRQKALAKLHNPEELDVPVRLARPRGWLVLAVVAVVVVVAGVWAITGSLPRKLTAAGILTHQQGSFTMQSPVTGQITAVFVSEGSTFPNGTPILSVRTEKSIKVVRSVTAGRVTAVFTRVGAVVTAGADLATVERIDDANDPLVAVLYAPGTSGSLIPLGSAVDLTVRSVPALQYGVLRGRVLAVGQFPETRQQISEFLGDGELGETFSEQGQPVKVVVELLPAPETASGYTWSSVSGPPYNVDSRTLVTGAIHLAPSRPVDWVIAS